MTRLILLTSPRRSRPWSPPSRSPAAQGTTATPTPGFEQLRKIDVHSHIYEDLPVVNAMLRRINLRVINVSVPATDGHLAFMHRFNAGARQAASRPVLVGVDVRPGGAQRAGLRRAHRQGARRDVRAGRGDGEDLEGGRARAEAAGRIVRAARRSDPRSRLRPSRVAEEAAAGASRRAARGVAAARPEGRALRLLLAEPEVAPLRQA